MIATAGCIAFYAIRVIAYSSFEFSYLIWNLLLAALPLGFAWLLVKNLKTSLWSAGQNVLLSILWLGFLPNSFYLATDFIHLLEVNKTTLLFDVLFFLVFTLTGLFLGFTSVVMVHRQLRSRFSKNTSDGIIVFVFLLCSFAIYLGRYLRWNTWDILVNPAGLLFDVSNSIVHPRAYGQTFSTTLMFFVYISITYVVVIQFLDLNSEVRRINATSRKKTSKQVR